VVLSKEAILDHLYGGLDEPNPKIIDVFICKIRKKLQALGVDDFIETNWGRGYMVIDHRQDAAPAETSQRSHANMHEACAIA
jgi:two-component system cell cycle response regulator CtrA